MYWVPRLFIGLGVLLLVAGAVFAVLTARFVASADRAEGTVVDRARSVDDEDGSVVYFPIVRFTTAEARTVEFKSSASTSDEIGDRVDVLYDPDDPTDARLAGFFNIWGFSLIFGLIGTVFVGVSAIIVRRTRRPPSKEDVQWLRRHGRPVQGRSPRAVYCADVTVQDSSPFRVEVDVDEPERDQVRVLASEYVWFDPAPYLEDRESLDVYVDPDDPERYLVDVSFLPSKAE